MKGCDIQMVGRKVEGKANEGERDRVVKWRKKIAKQRETEE